jgi:hypothetical protein
VGAGTAGGASYWLEKKAHRIARLANFPASESIRHTKLYSKLKAERKEFQI